MRAGGEAAGPNPPTLRLARPSGPRATGLALARTSVPPCDSFHARRCSPVGAVLTLALGIGATSAIFSLADATLLRPVAIRDPGRVWKVDFSWSYPDFRDLEAAPTPFSQVGRLVGSAIRTRPQRRGRRGQGRRRVRRLLRACRRPASRGSAAQRRRRSRRRAGPVAVLSERAWARLMNHDRAIVGTTIQLNRRPIVIVGIVPRAFKGLSLQNAPDVFLPLSAMPC